MRFLTVGLILLLAMSGLAQEPLKAPPDGVTLKAESQLIAYVGDKWVKVDDSAVRQTHAVLLYELGSSAQDLGVMVERYEIRDGQLKKSLGQAEAVPTEKGVEFRISVPSAGEWFVTVIDYKTRRHYPLTVEIGEAPTPDPPKPGPPGPPTPEGKRVVVVIEEVQDRTPQVSDMLSDLREQLKDKHRLLVVDDDTIDNKGATPDWLKPYLTRAGGVRPAMIVVDEKTGSVVFEGVLPKTTADALEVIQ